jgi:hypothetical protein
MNDIEELLGQVMAEHDDEAPRRRICSGRSPLPKHPRRPGPGAAAAGSQRGGQRSGPGGPAGSFRLPRGSLSPR